MRRIYKILLVIAMLLTMTALGLLFTEYESWFYPLLILALVYAFISILILLKRR